MGFKPLKSLHARVCVPLASAVKQPHAFYAGLRLVAIDGSNFDVPDELANVSEFGRPGSRIGFTGYPQAKCAVLVECATHAILAANLGAYRTSEWDICEPLMERLQPDMLCLADRGFRGYGHWKRAQESGAQLLWRATSNRQLPVVTALADGSYLSVIYPNPGSRRTREGEITLRVIDYALPGQPAGEAHYRLITTLLDPTAAPALELARLYHERWEVEAVFAEMKTQMVQRRRTLRSKTPEGVRQEFYGWVLAHYAVCWLMHEAASAHRPSPIAFNSVNCRSRATFNYFGVPNRHPEISPLTRPRKRKQWHAHLLREAASLRCVSSRGRFNPRMVKRRQSSFPSHQIGTKIHNS